jgi:hypothetical protein
MAIAASSRAVIFGPLTSYASGVGTAQSNLVTVATPWGIKVRAHRLVASRFLAACVDAEKLPWNPLRIDSFAPRSIRGSTAVSMHAYGLAWDFFATPPNVVPPGGVWTPDNAVPRSFAEVFKSYGFRWGGEFKRVDLPHIEWAEGRPEALVVRPPAPEPIDPQAPLEAEMTSPAVCVSNGTIYRFLHGDDDKLWVKIGNGNWANFNGTGGRPDATLGDGSSPACCVDPANGNVVVVITGTDEKLYESGRAAGASNWSAWTAIGGSVE